MRKVAPLTGIVLLFILVALCMARVYDSGKDRGALVDADIPHETIEWLNGISGKLDDLISSFTPVPRPTPWGNSDDLGRDPESGLRTLEDRYFVFYFPDELTPAAHMCQLLALEAIPHLEKVMGKYFFPEEMNGRKVSVYLSKGQEDFKSMVTKICGGKDDSDYTNVAGITLMELSPAGMYLKGIVLNGAWCYADKRFTQSVLWHELSHYCFFASLDYSKRIDLPMWTYEGVAEYAAQPGFRPSFTEQEIQEIRKECSLSAPEFPQVFENYRGGHSIYCFMEDVYQLEGVKGFLETLYLRGLDAGMTETLGTDLNEFEEAWKNHFE